MYRGWWGRLLGVARPSSWRAGRLLPPLRLSQRSVDFLATTSYPQHTVAQNPIHSKGWALTTRNISVLVGQISLEPWDRTGEPQAAALWREHSPVEARSSNSCETKLYFPPRQVPLLPLASLRQVLKPTPGGNQATSILQHHPKFYADVRLHPELPNHTPINCAPWPTST